MKATLSLETSEIGPVQGESITSPDSCRKVSDAGFLLEEDTQSNSNAVSSNGVNC